MTDATTMNPSRIYKAVKLAVEVGQPTMLWGAPGVGKSKIIEKVAADTGRSLIDVRVSQLDAVDLRGVPSVADGFTVWNIPDFLPREERDGKAGILFLDEINSAPVSVSAAAYQLILDRRLGDYRLPDGWICVAAGNRESDKAVTNRMPTALANRFMHLDFGVDIDDWTTWALGADVSAEVIAFLRFRPELIHQFDPQSKAKAFASPRSWEFASRIISGNPDKDVRHAMLAGTIGDGPAAEFEGFLRVYKSLPNVDAILLNPEKFSAPTDPATLYALAGALSRKATPDNMDSVVKITAAMPAEYSVVCIKDAVTITPEITQTKAFIDWSVSHGDILA